MHTLSITLKVEAIWKQFGSKSIFHPYITRSRTHRYPSIYWRVWSSTRIHQRQWGKSLSIFHCFMRKQYTKIHTDFELSICRLHPSVFISLYNMQHWRYTLQTPLSQMLSNYCPICFCCIFGTVSVVVLLLTSQTSSVLCTHTQNKHLDNWHVIIMINNE